MNSNDPTRSPRQRALLAALAYALLAAGWITLSERMLSDWLTLKDWLFVAVTGALLYGTACWHFNAAGVESKAAREQTERLRAVLASIDDLVFVFDRNYRFVECYQPTAETLRLPPDQFLNKRVDQVDLPTDVAMRFINAMDALAERGEAISIDYPLDIPLGQRWFSARFSRLPDAAGLLAGFTCVVRDISDRQRAEAQLRSSEQRFRTLLDDIPNISVQGYDLDRRVVFWNNASEKLYGYTREEALGRPLEELIIPPPMRAAVVELHHQWITEHIPIPAGELDLQDKHGATVAVYSSHAMICGSNGQPEMYCLDVDLSELRKAQSELRLAARFFEDSGEAIMITGPDKTILAVNTAFSKITGYARSETLGRPAGFMSSGHHDADYFARMAQCLQTSDHWQGEIWNRRKNGQVFPEWLGISAVRNEQDCLTHYVAIFSDISEKKATEARLEFLAHHDPLTRLPNRILVRDRLAQALAQATREESHVALLYLDLDHFKMVNDTLGHVVGDQLLKAVVWRLQRCVRDTDTISRLGGDEFLIVLTGVHDTSAISLIGEKILQQMDAPFVIEEHTLSVSFSIGIALYPDDGGDFDTLLLKADTAMYHAKESGRNAYRYFTERMNSQAHERLRMQSCLRQAIERGELQLHYQPQVDLGSGTITGAEALLRWNSAELGSVSPARFIPVAEDSGLIIPIGEWVLREACRQAQAWRLEGLPPLSIAVNMSPLQFKRSDPCSLISRILDETGLPATCLELEITESLLVQDIDEVLATLGRLKMLGLRIAIDDFGTGYSSLSYLKRFPINKLKIDQSFVRDIASDADDAAIVHVIIELGRILKLKTIAEGVEDTSQLSFLIQQGCGNVQGYLFGRPMPAAQFAHFLVEENNKISIG